MAPKIPNQKSKYIALSNRLAKYILMVENIYDAHNLEASQIAVSTGHDGSTPFSFSDYPLTKQRTQDLIDNWRKDMAVVIYSGTSAEWRESNLVQDLLADKVISYYWGKEHGKRKRKYYETNSEALQAFQRRRDKGMNLSDKIWLQGEQYRKELEDAISCGIQKGMSAVTLSKRVSKYLNDFPQLQKDYKEKYGKVTDAINCEYRSMRLARTEINMAYRSAEQTRWQQMDFIVGFEVKKSKVHDERMPHGDVCDILSEKKYPKDFKFVGWHPNCMCYVIPIMKTEDEFFEDDESSPSVNTVREYPKEMRDWIETNKERIERAQERGTLPYWLRDNPSLTSPKKSVWEIARERHANRDDAAIQKAWDERKARNLTIRTGNNVLNVYNGRGYGELGGELEMRRKRLEKALSLNDTSAIQSETKALAAEMARKRKLTIQTADNVLNVAKDYHEVTTSPLIDAKKTTDYAHIRRQTIDLAKEISSIKKDDAYLSALIPDVRMWKKQFTSAELHKVYDAVETKLGKLSSFTLAEQQKKLAFEIQYVANPSAYKYGAVQHATWQVAESAYKKALGEVSTKIKWNDLSDKYSALSTFKTKSQPFKNMLADYLDAVAKGDIVNAESALMQAEQKKLALNKAYARTHKGKAGGNHVIFKKEDFSENRKKNAKSFRGARDADDYYFDDAVNAYKTQGTPFKAAAEEYTLNSSSMTRILRGIPGWHEQDSWYVSRNKPHIEALTNAIAQNRLRDDVWVVRDERAVFFALKTGGNYTDKIEKNINSFERKARAKYAGKRSDKEIDELIEKYKEHEFKQLVGKTGTDESFLSTSSHTRASFSGTGGDNRYGEPKVRLEIYCPKGTQALYAAPYNHYNSKHYGTDGYWDGTSRPLSIGEAEIFLQRGTTFRVTDAKYDFMSDKWYVKLEVIEQNPRNIKDYIYVPSETGYRAEFD